MPKPGVTFLSIQKSSALMRLKPKKPIVTVGQFFETHGAALQMKLVGRERGFERVIREPTINRPGLGLAGYTRYFAKRRIQVLGKAELAYLQSLSDGEMRERIRPICQPTVPCVVMARNGTVPRTLSQIAAENDMAIFRTPLITMRFINAATIALEMDFAPTVTEFGSMMEIHGMGVMIRGSSGVGKSECVLGLIERGYSLVSDDITVVRAIESRDLLCFAPELTRNHIEVRGLGIINVAAIFGVGSIRREKRLDVVVTLKNWDDMDDIERVGIDRHTYRILGIDVPHITIPVRIGRDLARLVEVAALDQKLKYLGQNSAEEFNKRLISSMTKSR